MAKKKKWENVPKPAELKDKLDGVSLGKDKNGYFIYTHRARSKSYSSPDKIPKSRIKFIESTGAAAEFLVALADKLDQEGKPNLADTVDKNFEEFFNILSGRRYVVAKVKSNDRMVPLTKKNLDQLQKDIEDWSSPHRKKALDFVEKHSIKTLFEILHSMRRWYSGQTMVGKLIGHRNVMKEIMKLDPKDAEGIYRGFKVPNDDPLADVKPGEIINLPVKRNRGISSWSASQDITNRFSGGGKGKTGIIVKLLENKNAKPILAPPSHTEKWFDALYSKIIGSSFRPKEKEFLIYAPKLKVEVVRVKK